MRGDVAGPGLREPGRRRAALAADGRAVAPVAGERAARVRQRVQLARLVAVVDEHQESPRQPPRGLGHPGDGRRADLGAPARLEADAEARQVGPHRRRRRAEALDEPVAVAVDVHLAHAIGGHHDRVDRQRVEQLVGEHDAPHAGRHAGGRAGQPRGVRPEGGRLGGPRRRTALDQRQAQRPVEVGAGRRQVVQDVAGQAPAPGARLHQGRRAAGGGQPPHLGELARQQRAEHRSAVDAGKEIARATGPPVGAGVVAELRMVERQVHVLRERQRTLRADPPDDELAERHGPAAAGATPCAPAGTPACRRAAPGGTPCAPTRWRPARRWPRWPRRRRRR